MTVNVDLLYEMIGDRVKRARQSAGVSQAKLAKKLGMSRTSVVNIEAGRQRAPLHVLWQIGEILGTEPILLVPRLDEYHENGEAMNLDPATIEKIERAASGDPATRRELTRFIERAVARAGDGQ
jgi:transcriptional regulator with XRE-family HTH domain